MSNILQNVNSFYRTSTEDLGIDLRIVVESALPVIVATYTAGYIFGTWARNTRESLTNR